MLIACIHSGILHYLTIESLLTDPNTSSPANPEAAALLKRDKKEYNRKIRNIAERSVVM